MQVINGQDQPEYRSRVVVKFAVEICMKNKGGSIEKNEYMGFKQGKRSTVQYGGYRMDG